jgi:hypothetical protein
VKLLQGTRAWVRASARTNAEKQFGSQLAHAHTHVARQVPRLSQYSSNIAAVPNLKSKKNYVQNGDGARQTTIMQQSKYIQSCTHIAIADAIAF